MASPGGPWRRRPFDAHFRTPVLLAEEDPFRIAAAFDLFVLERPLCVYTRQEGLPPPPPPPPPQAPVAAVAEVLGR